MPEPAEFIRQNCELLPGPIARVIKLYQAGGNKPLWHLRQEELVALGLEEPYWAFAWAGGQALAQYLLDNPTIAQGRTVLSLASGGGAEAIAAKLTGATKVVAADIDPFAQAAACLNADENDVELVFENRDLLLAPPPPVDLILAGDIFYEKATADRVWPWLVSAQAEILIGDPGRSYLPKKQLQAVAKYRIDWTNKVEDSDLRNAIVWQMTAQQ